MNRLQGASRSLQQIHRCCGFLCQPQYATDIGIIGALQEAEKSSGRSLLTRTDDSVSAPSLGFGLLSFRQAHRLHASLSAESRRSLSTSGTPSPFEGLKLQVPNNPFASRKPRPAVQKLVLYRGRGMLLFRFIVRAKVFQLMGFLACAVFASVVLTTSNPNPMDLAAVGALAVGCVVTSYCIWYYSGRYVGEMSLLLPERRVVRFSVLDFWGNREDNDVPVERLVAPWRNRSVAEVRSQARQALMPVEVAGDRQYYISVPHGHVLQKEILQKLLYGAPLDEEGPASKGTSPGIAAAGKPVAGSDGPAGSREEMHAAGPVEGEAKAAVSDAPASEQPPAPAGSEPPRSPSAAAEEHRS